MGLVVAGGGSSGVAYRNSTSKRQKLLAPFDPISLVGTGAVNNGNFILGCRVEVPVSGTLHDLAVFVRVAAGNLRVGVYDTGDLSPGNRKLLYGSGSVAAVGADVFQVIADPNLAVVAGTYLDLVAFPDNNTLSLGRITQLSAAQNTLPANFIPTPGGASPKLNWAFNLAYQALPDTISEAQCGAAGSCIWVGGRIS